MSWNFSSKYFKKTLYGLEYDCLKLSVVKLEKVVVENIEGNSIEETKEVETNSINLLIKKDTNGNVYLISDNMIIENITKIISKINPMMVFVAQMFIPMFKPIQCKFDVDNKQILELFLNTQKIDVSDNLSSFDINSISNTGLQLPFMNTGLFSTQSNKINQNESEECGEEGCEEGGEEGCEEGKDVDTGSDESTDDEIDENKVDVEEDVEEDGDGDEDGVGEECNEIDKKLESLLNGFSGINLNNSDKGIGNFDIGNLVEKMGGFDMSNLNNLLNIPDIKGIDNNTSNTPNPSNTSNLSNTPNPSNTNITNLTSTIGNIWTDKYYDEENLDDFLMNDDFADKQNSNTNDWENGEDLENREEDNNLTRYLKLSPDEISMELSLTNLNDYESLKESIKMLTSREMFDEQIKMYEKNEYQSNMEIPNIPGTKKWVGVDDDGEKCIYYTLGVNSTEKKNFKYRHFQQLETILLELVNFIEQM